MADKGKKKKKSVLTVDEASVGKEDIIDAIETGVRDSFDNPALLEAVTRGVKEGVTAFLEERMSTRKTKS